MTEDELKKKAIQWIRSQGWNENNLPNDEYIQMCDAYVAGAKEAQKENEQLEKELEKLEDKHVLLLEENARYFKLITLLKKENKELETQKILEVEE